MGREGTYYNYEGGSSRCDCADLSLTLDNKNNLFGGYAGRTDGITLSPDRQGYASAQVCVSSRASAALALSTYCCACNRLTFSERTSNAKYNISFCPRPDPFLPSQSAFTSSFSAARSPSCRNRSKLCGI
eukprot:508968-Rhodomonas_salina.1